MVFLFVQSHRRGWGNMTNAPWTLTKLRMPESPRSNSCMIKPYSMLFMPAQPYPSRLAPKKPSSPISRISCFGKAALFESVAHERNNAFVDELTSRLANKQFLLRKRRVELQIINTWKASH